MIFPYFFLFLHLQDIIEAFGCRFLETLNYMAVKVQGDGNGRVPQSFLDHFGVQGDIARILVSKGQVDEAIGYFGLGEPRLRCTLSHPCGKIVPPYWCLSHR
jgi:hypothetical protein